MLLHTLLRQFDPNIPLDSSGEIEITGISEDSRLVKPGDLFIARSGLKADGRQYAADAAARGAVAVVASRRIEGCGVPQVVLPDPGGAISKLANLYYEQPSRRVQVLGITGTNGKTTTAYLIRHILASIGRRCGLIGTVEVDDGRRRVAATMTTPSAIEFARLLADMRDCGCWSCAAEVSSHALEQNRVAGVRFAGAAFTNLTGDHQDYHGNMENYAAAKARLFEGLDRSAVAVVNAYDPWSDRMVQKTHARVMRFGIGRKGDYRARDVSTTPEGSRFVLRTPDGETTVQTPMIGQHNIANALTAAALLGEVCGLSVHQIAAALRTANGAPGRLQAIRCGQEFAVYIDYAHTDDGLKNVLRSVRPLAKNRVRLVFGCGGDRDRTKRRRMARVAYKLADAIYVTSDNPRTENPQAIIDEIVRGFPADVAVSSAAADSPRTPPAAKLVHVEPDRRIAIRRALSEAEPGDVVLLAGKGHEDYQIVGEEKHHFDDVEEATRFLQQRVGATNAA